MISPEQKSLLKEILGKDYVSKVREKMKEKKITKPNGEFYSDSSIKGVLNDGQKNYRIENCIYEVAVDIKKTEAKLEEMRKQLLSGKSTATVESNKHNE